MISAEHPQKNMLPDEKVPDNLMAGLLEHLACYLQTGRTRSAHQARLILDRLASHPSASGELRDRGQHLSEVLEDGLSTSGRPGASSLEPRPWLTWEWLEDAA